MATGDGSERRSPIVGHLQLGDGPPHAPTPGEPPALGAPRSADEPVEILLELNTLYPGGLDAVRTAFFDIWRDGFGHGLAAGQSYGDAPAGLRQVSARLYQCTLSQLDLQRLIARDRAWTERPFTIFRAWPDYIMYPQIDRSAPTVKVDAAWRSFGADGSGIVWAVVDSGIDGAHRHFANLELATEYALPAAASTLPRTGGLHRDFTSLVLPGQLGDIKEAPLTDDLGHGTHVAGIIAGRCPSGASAHVASSDEPPAGAGYVARPHGDLVGMAPECELVSLKVMRQTPAGTWVTSSAAVIAALEYIRTQLNVNRATLRIYGVNLSLGCEWDPTHYAAGQSPLCQAINELVDSGVVVVISAGNGGKTDSREEARQSVSVMGSITEPAHAAGCIAVGSTHREAPHTFGVSWTSGKGPTLDGRCKPDVVAPGEWITSAATGTIRAKAGLDGISGPDGLLTYAEQCGTSMAAPHVSGVIASFLSVRREFIGRPREVKEMLAATATDLGRERYAQGAGLVDAMRLLSNS